MSREMRAPDSRVCVCDMYICIYNILRRLLLLYLHKDTSVEADTFPCPRFSLADAAETKPTLAHVLYASFLTLVTLPSKYNLGH